MGELRHEGAKETTNNSNAKPPRFPVKLWKFGGSLLFALLCAGLVQHFSSLNPAGLRALFIVVFAAGLWVTEAIAAFAVSILVIALDLALLGMPGGVYAKGPRDWEQFVAVLGNPLIWLFLGGFVLAAGAQTTGLDRLIASRLLGAVGNKPSKVLAGAMALTFVMSMFMSNTATTAMVIAMMTPLIVGLAPGEPIAKALLLGIAAAANIGGMGSIIGTPPNAIAVGMLVNYPSQQVNFLQWMIYGLPPALLLAVLTWFYLRLRYPSELSSLALPDTQRTQQPPNAALLWQRWVVGLTFIGAIALWMSSAWHHIPATVVALGPIALFTCTGILNAQAIRQLSWDVLLLLAGGLALGASIKGTGLADWLIHVLPLQGLSTTALILSVSVLCLLLSNFMSNTAAANILIPIGIAFVPNQEASMAVPIALAASAAMGLPISTPPNAIAFAEGRLRTQDFIQLGAWIGLLAPFLIMLWLRFIQ